MKPRLQDPVDKTGSPESVYAAKYQWLLRWALHFCDGDREMAEDLVQDTFMRMLSSWATIRDQERPERFLYTYLKYGFLRLRNADRREALQPLDQDFDLLDISAASTGPGLIEWQEEIRAVIDLLCWRKAAAKSASLLLFRFFHGMFPSEIMLIASMSRKAVDDSLASSKLEARTYVNQNASPRADTLRKKPVKTALFVAWPPRSVPSTEDMIQQLLQVIYASGDGDCLSYAALRDRYSKAPRTPFDCWLLSHIVYTITGPGTISGGALFSSMPGVLTVTATQPGNAFYQPATAVVQTYNFQKEPLPVRVNPVTIPFGSPIPAFTYVFGDGSFTPPANQFSGVPSFVTTATPTSAPGDYPITGSQGTLVSSFFDFQFVNNTLTILPPSSFILTATPASVVIPNGQARQVTITLTPVNEFVGSVTLGCSNLPAGVTCVSSPNTLATMLDVSGVDPVTATLTISAGAPVASAQLASGRDRTVLAGMLWLPALLCAALLTWQRRKLLGNRLVQRLLFVFLMLLGTSGLIACGSPSGSSASVQTGTTTIQVTGAGTSTAGATSASLALSVTIE